MHVSHRNGARCSVSFCGNYPAGFLEHGHSHGRAARWATGRSVHRLRTSVRRCGTWIDAFIVATTSYSGLGGFHKGAFAGINQDSGTSTSYDLYFYDAGTTDLIDATGIIFNLIVLDIDGTDVLGIPREAITAFTPVSFQLSNGVSANPHVLVDETVPGETRFFSDGSASNAQNPPAGATFLTQEQQDYSALLSFEDKNTIQFELTIGGSSGRRNFLFEGGFLLVPEPARGVLSMIGVGMILLRRRRR